MDFHLQFLTLKYSINAEELRCLSRALGYPTPALSHLFKASVTRDVPISEVYSQMQTIEFEDAMNQRFNIYPSEWNVRAILTSLLLLSHRSINFENLNLVRCVFHFYEEDDGFGLRVNKSHLLQYLKMCGRIISPMKLVHRLKHMHNRLYYPQRLQIWELLELVIWSDVFEFVARHSTPRLDLERTNNLYKIPADELSIIYTELKCFEDQNTRYIQEELTFPKGNFSKVLRIIQRPINIIRDTIQVRQVKGQAKVLSKRINSSNQTVRIAYGSCFRYNNKDQILNITNNEESQDLALEVDKTQNLLQSTPTGRPKTAPVVTIEDIEMAQQKIDSCKSDMETLDSKYQENFQMDMEYLSPGFWKRWNNRSRPHTSVLTEVNLIHVRKPSTERINSLARPKSGRSSPLHNRCLQDVSILELRN